MQNKAAKEVDPMNNHQPEMTQEYNVTDANEYSEVQQEDQNPFGPKLWCNKNRPLELVIGNPSTPLRTRKQMIDEFLHSAFISHIKP